MKLINETFKHTGKGFELFIEGAGKKLVTATDLGSQETVKFNRGKFEWMVKKGVFTNTTKAD